VYLSNKSVQFSLLTLEFNSVETIKKEYDYIVTQMLIFNVCTVHLVQFIVQTNKCTTHIHKQYSIYIVYYIILYYYGI
jgi:hypothetical protein